MQNTPIDTDRLKSLWCLLPPEPRKTPDGAQRKDREGNLQWVTSVTVVPKEGRRVESIDVVVSGLQPQGITVGCEVKIINLESNKWAVDGRSGESYRAEAITPVHGPAAPGGSPGPSSTSRGKSSGGES